MTLSRRARQTTKSVVAWRVIEDLDGPRHRSASAGLSRGVQPTMENVASRDRRFNSSGTTPIIKEGVGAKPPDWTGIAPNGDVITAGPDGNAVNNGPVDDYLP